MNTYPRGQVDDVHRTHSHGLCFYDGYRPWLHTSYHVRNTQNCASREQIRLLRSPFRTSRADVSRGCCNCGSWIFRLRSGESSANRGPHLKIAQPRNSLLRQCHFPIVSRVRAHRFHFFAGGRLAGDAAGPPSRARAVASGTAAGPRPVHSRAHAHAAPISTVNISTSHTTSLNSIATGHIDRLHVVRHGATVRELSWEVNGNIPKFLGRGSWMTR